jgi:N6-adenosine-specific RNA methylase IME4
MKKRGKKSAPKTKGAATKRAARKLPATSQPTLLPSKISVGKRHRKDYGDLKALSASIDARGGLLQPIVIEKGTNKLIAGSRRLKAWTLSRFAGQPIPVHAISIDAIIAGEWDENAQRKDFTLTESVAIKKEIELKLKTLTDARRRQHGGTTGGRKSEIAAGEKIRAADVAANVTGKARRTLDKAQKVVEAAEADPKKFGKLKSDMDRTGKVDGPFKRLQILQQTQALRDAPPPLPMRGPYVAGVVDFPWPAEKDADQETIDRRGRAMRAYPEMSIESGIKFMRSKEFQGLWAKDHTLYFWTTNFHMDAAFRLLHAAGYDTHSTIGTWGKNKMGRGAVLRGQTEHCIIATRGKPTINLTNQTTLWQGEGWQVREDSRKPDAFYALVEALTPAPRYCEIFSRGGRGDLWDCHGDQVGKFAPSVPKEKQAEILAPVTRSADELMLAALEAIEKGAQPDLRLLGKKELKQLERYAEGKKTPKLTRSGRSHLIDMRRDNAVAKMIAALPDDHDMLVKSYAIACDGFDRAVVAGDRALAEEHENAGLAVLRKVTGSAWGVWDGDPKVRKIVAPAAMPVGVTPTWGRNGLFALDVDGARGIVHASGHFDMGFTCTITFFPADPDKPFSSLDHVIYGDLFDWKEMAGKSFAEWCAGELRAGLKRRSKRAVGKKAITTPDKAYVLPSQWDGFAEPKAVTLEKARKALAAAAPKPPAPRVEGGKVSRTLPGRDRELIAFAEKNGHVVSRTLDHKDASTSYDVATCQCGWSDRVKRAAVSAGMLDGLVTAHWREFQATAQTSEAAAAGVAKAAKKSNKKTQTAGAVTPAVEAVVGSAAAGAPVVDGDQLDIPGFLKRKPDEQKAETAS